MKNSREDDRAIKAVEFERDALRIEVAADKADYECGECGVELKQKGKR